MQAMIDCDAGTMSFIDDDGNVQIFGKNRSQIADMVGYIGAIVLHASLVLCTIVCLQ